jgi:hypothetical protein
MAGSLTIKKFLARHDKALLRAAILIMLAASLVWLGYEFWRLWQPALKGGVDLRLLHGFTHDWFAGSPIYRESHSAVHPPATYAILWPMLGWMTLPAAKYLYAASALFILALCMRLVVRECRAEGFLQSAFAALIPTSMYAAGAAIGNGQFTIHVITMLAAGLLLAGREQRGLRFYLVAPAVVLVAFIKPNIAGFFFWILLFVPSSPLPALFVAAGYASLTVFAAAFQRSDFVSLIRDLLVRGSFVGIRGSATGNVANLHIWLNRLGLTEWNLPVTLAALTALGFWIYRHRRIEPWILLGVTAYIARMTTYHRWYDDMLILLPMVALFRIARERSAEYNAGIKAGILLAATMLASIAPGGLFLFPAPWNKLYVAGQVSVWIAGLVFLLRQAGIERKRIIEFDLPKY